jgi:hypothetical protein
VKLLCAAVHEAALVKVFGCRPHEGWAGLRGRRPQTSKGGKRGTSGETVRQTLWGFRPLAVRVGRSLNAFCSRDREGWRAWSGEHDGQKGH